MTTLSFLFALLMFGFFASAPSWGTFALFLIGLLAVWLRWDANRFSTP